MQVAYITRKVFADDSEEIRIKHNNEITLTTITNAQRTRALNKFKRELLEQRFYDQICNVELTDRDYVRKRRILNNELKLRNIQNLNRSAHRSRQNLYDICRCNDFEYFVTYTFDGVKIDRLNDKIVKRKFTQLQNYLHKTYPNMFYTAVPEYHKKGGLHFHLLVGGVTMEELGAVPAVSKRGRRIFKKGKQIFNVTKWKYGFSTLSKIDNSEAAKHYICKYISKQHLDDRFFGKRRYYVSRNIRRPEVQKWCTSTERCMEGIDLNVFTVAYANMQKRYAVLTHDGNGIAQFDRNTDEVKQHMAKLTAPTARTDQARAVAPSGACPYSTLRTLNRNDNRTLDWNYLKKLAKKCEANAIRNFKPPHEDFDFAKCEEQAILDQYYASMAIKSCDNNKSDIELCREIGLID